MPKAKKIMVKCTYSLGHGHTGTEKKIEKLKFDSVSTDGDFLYLKTKDGFCVKLHTSNFAVVN
jgi:hypothetical protein